MSEFLWPQPDQAFVAGVRDPVDAGNGLYFICYMGRILATIDDDQWAPASSAALAEFAVHEQHFLGHLGSAPAYAVEVKDPGSAEFIDLRSRLGSFTPVLFNLVGRALQVNDWHRSHQYCGKCGSPTVDHAVDRARVCDGCGLHFYPRLSPSIIVLIHRGDEVLLGRNHLFPEGLFSTLAGFVEPGESIEETVRREVKEEVGVNVGNLSYRGSQPWPFPNSLMLGFHAEYESGEIELQVDEIAEAKWFRCDDLPMIPGKFAISRWLIDEYLGQRGFESP